MESVKALKDVHCTCYITVIYSSLMCNSYAKLCKLYQWCSYCYITKALQWESCILLLL